ncbi:DUF742 domain-containing protein [Salininema proteolyticum]|uniref:DUF742 domain-containing protein n=1 Tax=Salininema proteolyticum TaxID=1607685 RepID=A0ABV8U2V2_9ACTN
MVFGGGEEPTGSLVRPYAVTRGRTRPQLEIALEALIETTMRGRSGEFLGGREQQAIAHLCGGGLQSLAEIAARMEVPIGVARVLVADMAASGLLAVHEPTAFSQDSADGGVGTDLLERVLSGLRRL